MNKFSLALLLGALAAQAATGYKVVSTSPIPNNGGWDYVTFDNDARRIYVSHATQVEVLDADTLKPVGAIADTPGVHGIAIATPFKHGFTSNGKEDKVSMFDPATLKLIKKIDVGKGPDGIYYSAASKRVFTCNHGSDDMTAIDAETGNVVGTIKVDGGGEQMITAKNGLIYVNIEDKAEVVAFDPKTLAIKHHFPIGLAKTPTGLAYSAKTNHLFIACREKPTMVVMDAETGKVVTSFPIGAGVDWAEFDADAGLVFTSNGGGGNISVFHETSATAYEDAGAIVTKPGAKTMAFDPKTKKIFLPFAEYTVTPNADPAKRPTRTMNPGSFTMLVVGK